MLLQIILYKMSSTERELVEVSMVTEVIGEAQKDDGTMTTVEGVSAVDVAMETVSEGGLIEVEPQKRSVSVRMSGSKQSLIIVMIINFCRAVCPLVVWRQWSMQ